MSEKSTADVKAGEETVYVADNVDEFVQRHRWQQLLSARTKANEAFVNIGRRRVKYRREFGLQEAERLVREETKSGVMAYILECEPLFQRTRAGQKLWSDTTLISASVNRLFNPEEGGRGETVTGIKNIRFHGNAPVKISAPRDGPGEDGSPTITLRGVKDFAELGDQRVDYDYTVSVATRNRDAERQRSATSTVSVPIDFSREAFRATSALLNHLGPGLEFGEDDQTVGGDYSDMLEKLDDE